jgi:hypothetical protein
LGKLGEIWNQYRSKSADESLDFLFDEVQFFQPTDAGMTTSLPWSRRCLWMRAAARLKVRQNLRMVGDFTFCKAQ